MCDTISLCGSATSMAAFFRELSQKGTPAQYSEQLLPIVNNTVQAVEKHDIALEVSAPAPVEEPKTPRRRRTKAEIEAEAAPKAPVVSTGHQADDVPSAPLSTPPSGAAPWAAPISKELLHKALADYGVRLIQTGKTQDEADAALMFLISTYGSGASSLGAVPTECFKELYDAAIASVEA